MATKTPVYTPILPDHTPMLFGAEKEDPTYPGGGGYGGAIGTGGDGGNGGGGNGGGAFSPWQSDDPEASGSENWGYAGGLPSGGKSGLGGSGSDSGGLNPLNNFGSGGQRAGFGPGQDPDPTDYDEHPEWLVNDLERLEDWLEKNLLGLNDPRLLDLLKTALDALDTESHLNFGEELWQFIKFEMDQWERIGDFLDVLNNNFKNLLNHLSHGEALTSTDRATLKDLLADWKNFLKENQPVDINNLRLKFTGWSRNPNNSLFGQMLLPMPHLPQDRLRTKY